MTVRPATDADLEEVGELWQGYMDEAEPPPYFDSTWEEWRPNVASLLSEGIGLLAEEDGRAVGMALATLEPNARAHLAYLYVRPDSRLQGIARGLLGELLPLLRERGVEHFSLDVMRDNEAAIGMYERLGFDEMARFYVSPLKRLEQRLAESAKGPSFGSIHVQSDDVEAVLRAVRQFVPRLPGGSAGSVVVPARDGWTAVYDELCDRVPEMLKRLAREISDRMGAVVVAMGVEHDLVVRYVAYERGRIVDEYLSVPEYHGPLPPGDVIAMRANARLMARLTNGDAEAIKEAAPTGQRVEDLPPARELITHLAELFGIQGGGHGYAEAGSIEGAIPVAR